MSTYFICVNKSYQYYQCSIFLILFIEQFSLHITICKPAQQICKNKTGCIAGFIALVLVFLAQKIIQRTHQLCN